MCRSYRLLVVVALVITAVLVLGTSCAAPTPTPTPTPLPSLPPRVINRTPDRGQEQTVLAPIAITFDQPMDHSSVESAFTISPSTAGSFSWQGDTFLFAPAQPGLAWASVYHVSLGTEARSATGLSLPEPLAFEVRTTGYLEVAYVQPAPGTESVASDALVTVMFNRPVVPLTDVTSQSGLALRQILKFAPPANGEGKWLNTSIYTFRPTPGFAPGTTYSVVVDREQLADLTDAAMAGPFTWEFSTALPRVVQVLTSDPTDFIGPSPTISVTFNMPMDAASTEQRFTLMAEKGINPFPGRFLWDGTTMGFTPAVPLSLDTPYQVTVAAGARSRYGGEGTDDDFTWSFRTIQKPRVIRTTPQDGEKNVDPYTSLLVTFSSPMDPNSLLQNVTILPEPTEVYTTWVDSNTQVYISFGSKPSTTYTCTFVTDMKGRYGHRLEKPYQLTFTTRALSPSVGLPPDRVGTYNAYTTTAIYAQHVNVFELDIALYRLNRAHFVQLNGPGWWQVWEDFQPDSDSLIRRWRTEVDFELNQYSASVVPLAEDGISPLPAGYYYLELRAPNVEGLARHMLVVSRANLTLKLTASEALVWATDLVSGQPIADLDVELYGPGGETMASGRTDSDGVFSSSLTWADERDPWAPIMALAGSEDNPAAASTDWNSGISTWQFGLPGEPYLEPYYAYLYTDRSIYRPGQTVYFKGILRSDDDGRYRLPTGVEAMQAVVTDDQGKEIYRADLPLSDVGTLHGQLDLATDASLGWYYLSTWLGERSFGTSFRVAEYRKPEFEVSVSTDRDEYVHGQGILATVSASYYFGGPVSGANLKWRLMSQDHFFTWTGRDYLPAAFRQGYYEFQDRDFDSRDVETAYGRLVTEGQGTLDAAGTFTFELPADVAEYKTSQIFTLEASISDPSNQEVSGRHSVVVHKGDFYVGLAPQEYIGTAGRETRVNMITVDSQSVPVPNLPVTVVFLESQWYNVQQQSDDGRFYWTWELDETPVYTTTVNTDGRGTTVVAFTPQKGGSYRVRALARDQRENEIRSSTYLWISSREFVSWRQENHDRIELVTDKKVYQPGETVQLLIPSPFRPPVQALLTVERGHIYEHQVLTLRTNSEQVSIPISSNYAPNAYISVVIIKGTQDGGAVPSYRVGYAPIEVSAAEKELAVQLTPDRTTAYEPGTKAAIGVQATDYQGNGVEAEFSLQLVDLSVLALTNGDQGAMLDHFYRQRGLGVRTGATLAISVDRYRQQAQPPSAKGGDGGPGGLDVIRKRFLDTAYWNAQVRTDAQGRAEVVVDLPDNLTTWRATAKAITGDTLVGNGNLDIVTSKELIIRSVAPRFFVLGDQVQLGAVVHNNTDQALALSVSLDGQGVAIEGSVQVIQVAAHAQGTVNWQTRVISTPSAVLTWRASGGDLRDALQLTLPVYHYSTPEVVATAGQVPSGESRTETVRLPEKFDPSQGELTVRLDPSLAAGMRDGLTYLEQYPYDCIEQTVSRFLPNVITYRAMQKLGIHNVELEARLPQYVGVALQRIYALQHVDGGWGWWLADDSNPFISAYVLLGMNEAKRAGFAVDDQVMRRAASYLRGILDQVETGPADNVNTRAFVLYVLAEYGDGDLGRTIALHQSRDSLDLYGKAYLLMALHRLQPQQQAQIKTLLSELTSAAIASATGAHWEEDSIDYWTMNTNTRTTALVLQALVRADPGMPLLPNAVRWLMTARQEGHWETTQETAWSIMALTDFMVASGELQGNYDYRVTVNGEGLGQGRVTAQDLNETRKLVIAIEDLVVEEGNLIVLERLGTQGQDTSQGTPAVGQGQLYYALYLRYFLPVEDVRALDRGIVVARQYAPVEEPERAIDSVRVGDVIQVKLTIIAPNDLHYLVVEDPLPAGCEALDISLKTSSSAYQAPELAGQDGRPPYWWYFTESELRDEKVALFATYLAKGTYEYTYLMRASVAGRFLTMPARAYEMYFPEVFGRSDGRVFTVSE